MAACVEVLGVLLVVRGIVAERDAIKRFKDRPLEPAARRIVSNELTLQWQVMGRELSLEEKVARLERTVPAQIQSLSSRITTVEQESRAYTESQADALWTAAIRERKSLNEFVAREVRWLFLDLKWWGAIVVGIGVALGTLANIIAAVK
ncbi:MAG: hypothetical protein C3F10_03130 [Dehalococcoidia bacterium]|nr:MAG: hypothetical protein C3F10_03130 [Dehalococcoidia bacterium]